MTAIQALYAADGARARRQSRTFGTAYRGCRGLMVFDAIMSVQRNYQTRVLSLISQYKNAGGPKSLKALASQGPGPGWPFRRYEAAAIQQTAVGLTTYCSGQGVNEDAGVRRWAATGNLGHAFRLDPSVGQVKGVGLAVYCYLRMLSGATDTVKPDIRVGKKLRQLGFAVNPYDQHAVYDVAMCAAAELQVPPLILDQLLW
jgi:hypothetical protein